MDINILGICITAFLSSVGLAVAIFCGLYGFKKDIGEKITNVKDDIIVELSDIKENTVRIQEKANDLWDLAKVHLPSTARTIEVKLQNFGNTKISAEPDVSGTAYMMRIEKGSLSGALISKISKKTELAGVSVGMFGREVFVTTLGANILKIIVPSTDPTLCKKYMSILLKWLDTTYVKEVKHELEEFEEGITV